jgi:thiol-disulfide isomerase/thioredoxin
MAERRSLATAAQAGAGAVVAAALFAAVYLTLNGEGNGGRDAACAAAEPLAATLNPLVIGEVAAFQVASAPQALSDLAFVGSAGEPMTLAAFEGKVALLNLWATWCAPCRQEMPALDRLQSALGGEDFSVVPVSIDTGEPGRAREFLASVGVSHLPLYTDRSTDIFQALQQRGLAVGLPFTVLVDREGCHLGHMNGPAEWDSADGRRLIEEAIAGRSVTSNQ